MGLANLAFRSSTRSVLAVVAVALLTISTGLVFLHGWGAVDGAVRAHVAPVGPPPPSSGAGILAGITVGSYPEQVAFDPANGLLYATNHVYSSPQSSSCPYTTSLSTVSIVWGSNGTLVATPVVGKGAVGIAFDPTLKEMFVANCGSNNVSILSTVTNAVVGSVGVGSQPMGVAYDSTIGDIWVANSGSNNVSVISVAKVVATYVVGTSPQFLAYDAANRLMDVTNFGSSNVTAIGVLTHTRTTIPVGSEPLGIAYNPDLKHVYTANYGSANITIISKTTVYANPAAGRGPWAVVYDAGTTAVYVTNYGSGNVSVLENDHVAASVDPYSSQAPIYLYLVGAAYDSLTGDMLFANEGTNPGQLLDLPGATGLPGPSLKLGGITSAPVAGTADAQGDLYVPNEAGSNVTITSNLGFPTHSVSLKVGTHPHAAAYDPVANDVFVTNTGSNSVSVISASSSKVVASVPVGASPEAVAYDLVDHQVDVANFGDGTVSVISESSLLVVATIGVGIAPSGIAVSDGFVFVVNSGSDTMTVIDGSNNTAFETYGTGINPQAIVIDHGVGYIANLGSDNLTEFSASNPAVRSYSTLPAGGTFGGLVATDGFVYVAEPKLDRVAVVSEEFGQPSAGYYAAVGWVGTPQAPESLTYLPSTGDVYVAFGSASTSLTTILTRADTVQNLLVQPAVGTSEAVSVACSTANGNVYVLDGIGSKSAVAVYAPGATTAKLVGVGRGADAIVYDTQDQDVYVANGASQNVTVIAPINKVVANIPVGTSPIAITYDSASGDVFVANYGNNNVTVISGLKVVSNLAVGTSPHGIAYDWVTNEVYVADSGSSNLTVLSGGTSPTQVGSIGTGATPYTVAVDGSSGTVYVDYGTLTNITAITPAQVHSSIALPFAALTALIWDNGTSQLFVGGVLTSSVGEIVVLQDDNLVRTFQYWDQSVGTGGTWDPVNGDVYLGSATHDQVAVVATGL
jgi:YVTN family beta-propeller protein